MRDNNIPTIPEVATFLTVAYKTVFGLVRKGDQSAVNLAPAWRPHQGTIGRRIENTDPAGTQISEIGAIPYDIKEEG